MTAPIPIDGHEKLLEQAARAVNARFPEHSDIEDLYHDAIEFWLGGLQRYLPDYLADAEPRRIYMAVCRRLHRQCRAGKAATEGYAPQDQVRYTRREVDSLVLFALDRASLPEMRGQSEDFGSGPVRHPLVFTDTLASLADVRAALAGLPGEDRFFLDLVEETGRDWERLAPHYKVQAESLVRRHARILDRMVRVLGQDTDLEEYETHELAA